MKKLIYAEATKEGTEVAYEISSNNGTTTVSQNLVLNKDRFGKWVATMPMEDMPTFETPTEATQKLADWLERLGVTLKKHSFNTVHFSDL